MRRLDLLIVALVAPLSFAGCQPEGGCKSTITGNDNAVHQACGGSGDDSGATVTTPAPVVVPPTVITPIVIPGEQPQG